MFAPSQKIPGNYPYLTILPNVPYTYPKSSNIWKGPLQNPRLSLIGGISSIPWPSAPTSQCSVSDPHVQYASVQSLGRLPHEGSEPWHTRENNPSRNTENPLFSYSYTLKTCQIYPCGTKITLVLRNVWQHVNNLTTILSYGTVGSRATCINFYLDFYLNPIDGAKLKIVKI